MVTPEEYEAKFEYVCNEIESGIALRKAHVGVISLEKFYNMINDSKTLAKRYAHACEIRSEKIFEEIITIADCEDNDISVVDGEQRVNHDVIQRDRLRVDARKWVLAKMNPKKYGDKLDIDADVKLTGSISPRKWLEANKNEPA